MKIYHRLFGDLPKLGFGKVIGSIGFPGGAEWVDEAKSARLPLDAPMLAEQNINGLIEYHTAYEYQTIRYGQPAVILSSRSVTAADGRSRPHAYSHVAAPYSQTDGEIATDYITPNQMMCFDVFTTMEEFWALPKGTTTLPVTDWQPPDASSCQQSYTVDISDELQKALLVRYWKTISTRAFGGKTVYPLEIYLSDDGNCKNIIRDAKAFFAVKIIPFLPVPVHNILSMSAAVPKLYKHIFKQSALVFLYPEAEVAENAQTFDLRNGSYMPLEEEEAAFARRMMRHKPSSLLEAMYQVYQKSENCPSPAHCPFMADFQVAFEIDCLEHVDSRDVTAMLTHWKTVWERLLTCHNLQERQCHKVLEPVMDFVLKRLRGDAAAQTIPENLIPFVIDQALIAREKSVASELVATLGKAHALTVAAVSSVVLLPERAERTTLIIDMILNMYCIGAPLSAAEVQLLIQTAFLDYCKGYEPLNKKMHHYIKEMLKHYPDSYITMLPLSQHFMDGYKLLNQAITHLLNTMDETPDEHSLNDIRNMFTQYGNEENRHLLAEYMAACFWLHRQAEGVFSRIFQHIGANSMDVYHAILQSSADPATRLERPISSEELYNLHNSGGGIPDSIRQGVGAILPNYVDLVLTYSLQAKQNQFRWLITFDPQRLFLSDQYKTVKVYAYCVQWMNNTAKPLDKQDFQTLIGIIGNQGRALFAKHEMEFASAYNQLGPAGQSQAEALLPYLTKLNDYPYLCSLFSAIIRRQLQSEWNQKQDYWQPIRDLSNELAAKGIVADSIVDQTLEAAGRGLLRERYKRAKSANSFLSELDKYGAYPKTVYYDMWFGELRDAFMAQYSTLAQTTCTTLADVLALEHAAKRLKTADALTGNHDKVCCDAIVEAYHVCEAFPGQSGQQIVNGTMSMLRRLELCSRYPVFRHVQALLANYYFSGQSPSYAACGFFARVAMGLICSVLQEGSFDVGIMLRMSLPFHSNRLPDRLLVEENSKLLQAIISLFRILGYYDHRYPDVLLMYMETVPLYADYTARIRANRQFLLQWGAVNNDDNPALRRWLNI